MKAPLRLIICLFAVHLALLPAACGVFQKRLLSRKIAPAVSGEGSDPVLIGTIESVNPEQQFVLVRLDLRIGVQPGTKLEARSPTGLKSTLVVTPERKLSFLSADIEQGLPQAGDMVFAVPQAAAKPPEGAAAAGPFSAEGTLQPVASPLPESVP